MTCGVEINKDAWHIHVEKKPESKVIVKNMTHTCNGTRMNDNYMTRVESSADFYNRHLHQPTSI